MGNKGNEQVHIRYMKERGLNKPLSVAGQVRSFDEHLRELGLTRDEWHELKRVVVEGCYGRTIPIPEAVAGHRVALLVLESRRIGKDDPLYEAAKLLVGSSDGPSSMLALDKS